MAGYTKIPVPAGTMYQVPEPVPPTIPGQCGGPWGVSRESLMNEVAQTNSQFSEWGYRAAMQNGCLPPPGRLLPTWPPKPGTGFIYPQMTNANEEVLDLGVSAIKKDLYDNMNRPYSQVAPMNTPLSAAPAPGATLDPVNPTEIGPAYLTTQSDHAVQQLARRILNLPPATTMPMAEAGTAAAAAAAATAEAAATAALGREEEKKVTFSVKPTPSFWSLLKNSGLGALYDLKHWSHLPGQTVKDKLQYATTRDERAPYLICWAVLWVALLGFIIWGWRSF